MPRLALPPDAVATADALDRVATLDVSALPETRCSNCGAASPRAYCPNCGQAQRDFHRPLHTFASDIVESLTGWDHKIPATFGLLLARPGALTREFLAGRRKRYLSPFQLYFLASALLFLALRTPPPGGQGLVRLTHSRNAEAHSTGAPATVVAASPRATSPDTVHIVFAVAGGAVRFGGEWSMDGADLEREVRGKPIKARFIHNLQRRWADVQRRSSAEASAWAEGLFLGHLGTTLSLLVPAFALLCALLWRRAPLFYAEHIVFAVHTHAQGLIAIALARIVPGRLALIPTAWTLAYLWLAARRVYGVDWESRPATTVKVAVLAAVYFLLAALGLIATLLGSLILGS